MRANGLVLFLMINILHWCSFIQLDCDGMRELLISKHKAGHYQMCSLVFSDPILEKCES